MEFTEFSSFVLGYLSTSYIGSGFYQNIARARLSFFVLRGNVSLQTAEDTASPNVIPVRLWGAQILDAGCCHK